MWTGGWHGFSAPFIFPCCISIAVSENYSLEKILSSIVAPLSQHFSHSFLSSHFQESPYGEEVIFRSNRRCSTYTNYNPKHVTQTSVTELLSGRGPSHVDAFNEVCKRMGQTLNKTRVITACQDSLPFLLHNAFRQ